MCSRMRVAPGRPGGELAAGTLTLDTVEPDQRTSDALVFDPTAVVPGLELSDDPLLGFRAAVYSESVPTTRQPGEPSKSRRLPIWGR